MNISKRPSSQLNTALKDARNRLGFSQKQVADRLGVAEITVRRWEAGQAFPQPYWLDKLCQLYQATPEALGLAPASSITSTSDNQSSAACPDETPSPSDPALLPRKHFPKKRLLLLVVAANLLLLLLVGSTVLLIRSSVPQAPSVPSPLVRSSHPPSTPLQPSPTSSFLYQANWSVGLDQWPFHDSWHWSAVDGGQIESEKEVGNQIIFAPFQPGLSHYVVDVTLKRLAYGTAKNAGKAYGVIVGFTNNTGFVCGIGAHYLPEHFFLSRIEQTSFAYLTDLVTASTSLDKDWHNYRVEVQSDGVTFLLDGQQVGHTAVQQHVGKIGIYVDHTAVALRSFRVFS